MQTLSRLPCFLAESLWKLLKCSYCYVINGIVLYLLSISEEGRRRFQESLQRDTYHKQACDLQAQKEQYRLQCVRLQAQLEETQVLYNSQHAELSQIIQERDEQRFEHDFYREKLADREAKHESAMTELRMSKIHALDRVESSRAEKYQGLERTVYEQEREIIQHRISLTSTSQDLWKAEKKLAEQGEAIKKRDKEIADLKKRFELRLSTALREIEGLQGKLDHQEDQRSLSGRRSSQQVPAAEHPNSEPLKASLERSRPPVDDLRDTAATSTPPPKVDDDITTRASSLPRDEPVKPSDAAPTPRSGEAFAPVTPLKPKVLRRKPAASAGPFGNTSVNSQGVKVRAEKAAGKSSEVSGSNIAIANIDRPSTHNPRPNIPHKPMPDRTPPSTTTSVPLPASPARSDPPTIVPEPSQTEQTNELTRESGVSKALADTITPALADNEERKHFETSTDSRECRSHEGRT